MADLSVRPLCLDTWVDFEALAARHNGVWGGCWCMAFHARGSGWGVSAELNRQEKRALVAAGRAEAALVYRDGGCVGWCQYGRPAELPRIKAARAYGSGPDPRPDWRITCFFVDRRHRGAGVARAALAGALDLVARSGGGLVEAFPDDVTGREVSGSFLHGGTTAMFEERGFARIRPLGKTRWLMTRQVVAA